MGARGLGGLGSFRFKGKGGCFGVLGVGVSEANFFSAWGLAFGVWGSNMLPISAMRLRNEFTATSLTWTPFR